MGGSGEQKPPSGGNISEMAPVLKPRYPHRTDRYGMKFARGFRTAWGVPPGRRPLTRGAKRARRGS